MNQPVQKIEALTQCAGEAEFSNDIPAMNEEVFAAFVTADINPGSVISGYDTKDALVSVNFNFLDLAYTL